MKDYENQSETTKRETPRMLIITVVLKDFDDNNGQRKMAHFLILSMAGTTATFQGPSDEGQPWRTL